MLSLAVLFHTIRFLELSDLECWSSAVSKFFGYLRVEFPISKADSYKRNVWMLEEKISDTNFFVAQRGCWLSLKRNCKVGEMQSIFMFCKELMLWKAALFEVFQMLIL